MKYICKRNCYVRNPQGVLQYFKAEETTEYGAGAEIPEHFERADGKKKDIPDEREELKRKLKELKIDCPVNASIATMQKKLKRIETE